MRDETLPGGQRYFMLQSPGDLCACTRLNAVGWSGHTFGQLVSGSVFTDFMWGVTPRTVHWWSRHRRAQEHTLGQ